MCSCAKKKSKRIHTWDHPRRSNHARQWNKQKNSIITQQKLFIKLIEITQVVIYMAICNGNISHSSTPPTGMKISLK